MITRQEYLKLIDSYKLNGNNLIQIVGLFRDNQINYIDIDEFQHIFYSASKECNNSLGIAYCAIIKAWISSNCGDFVKMHEFNDKAEELFKLENRNDSYVGLLTVCNNRVYASIENTEIQEIYNQCRLGIDYAKKANLSRFEIYFTEKLARTYLELNLYDKAISLLEPYLDKEIKIASIDYMELKYLFLVCLINKEEYDYVIERTKDLLSNFKDIEFKIKLKCLLSEIYLNYGKLKDANKEIEEAKDLLEKNEVDVSIKHYIAFAIARFSKEMGDTSIAIMNYLQVYKNFKYFYGFQRRVLSELATLYNKNKDYAQAYYYLDKTKANIDMYETFKDEIVVENYELSNEQLNKIYANFNNKTMQIIDLAQSIFSSFNFEKICNNVVNSLAKFIPSDSISIIMYDNKKNKNAFIVDTLNERINKTIDDYGMYKRCIDLNEVISIKDYVRDMRNYHARGNEEYDKNIRSGVYLPLKISDKIGGCIALEFCKEDQLRDYEINLLKIVSDYVGIAFTNSLMYTSALTESKHDYLTNLYNRAGFFESIKDETAEYHDDKVYALLIVDIDNLKLVNDLHGHSYGDSIIKTTAESLDRYIGKDGIICRYGGDEFIALIRKDTMAEIDVCCNTIRKTIRKLSLLNKKTGENIYWTISIGVKRVNNLKKIMDIIDGADRALYLAKGRGKDEIVIIDAIEK